MLSPDKNLQSAEKRSQETQPLSFQNHFSSRSERHAGSSSVLLNVPGSGTRGPPARPRPWGGGLEGLSGCQGVTQPGPPPPTPRHIPCSRPSLGPTWGQAESLPAVPLDFASPQMERNWGRGGFGSAAPPRALVLQPPPCPEQLSLHQVGSGWVWAPAVDGGGAAAQLSAASCAFCKRAKHHPHLHLFSFPDKIYFRAEVF